MYKITNDERATLFAQMTDLLNKFEYEYSTSAIDKIIDKWCENKGTLIEAFKKHPNYIDGKFLIAFESDYERDIDFNAIDNFRYYIQRIMYSEDVKNNLPDDIKSQMNWDSVLPDRMWQLVYCDITCYKKRTIDELWAEHINKKMPEIKAHNGEKTSRVMNRICTYLNYHKHPEYNREFAKYADALTPRVIKRHTILSINPLDYLTMSFGNSWSSCHTIDKTNIRGVGNGYEGCYSSGTISYMLDNVSMVMYTVSDKYDGTDFFTQDKINRQMYHFGEDKLVQGRLYPQSNDDDENGLYKQYRSVVQEIIANIFNLPNLWLKLNDGINDYVIGKGTHYKDYYHFNNCNLSKIKVSENHKKITIGEYPICIECGFEHSTEDNINCCNSDDYETCADCGCRIHSDDVIWIDDEPYCSDCVTYCDCCCDYHSSHCVQWVASERMYICDDCLDEYYTRCEICGEFIYNDNINYIDSDNSYICDDCLDEYYTRCAECDEFIKKDDIKRYTDDNGLIHRVCCNCYDEFTNDNEAHEND